MTRARDRGLFTPPEQVPGYAAAAASGQLPTVPTSPPRLLPGRTARKELHRFLLKSAVTLGPVIFAPELLGAIGLPPLLAVVLGVGVLLLMARWWSQVGARMLTELRAGYVTFALDYGMVGEGGSSYWHATDWGVPWDHRGVWLLREDGSVERPPDLAVAPPGMYPSLSRPGERELWTGAAWTGQYAGG